MKIKQIEHEGKLFDTIKVTDTVLSKLKEAITISLSFEALSHKQLNITSTVGEALACKKKNLDWVINDINTGFDAFDNNGKTVQIKTRRYKGVRSAQTGNLLNKDGKVVFDYALLVLLEEDYTFREIKRVDRATIEQYLSPLNKKRIGEERKLRKAISISTFFKLAEINKPVL